MSEAGAKRCEELFKRLEGYEDDSQYSFSFDKIFGLPEADDGPGSYDWNTENVGTKWAYIEDADSEYGFACESAWAVPWNGIEYIFNEIFKVDPEFMATVSYEDEMPNFVGWATWHHGNFDEGLEYEWEEIEAGIMKDNPEIAECYDAEKREWIEGKEDEGRELMWDAQREWIDENSVEKMEEEVRWYMKNKQEIHEDYLDVLAFDAQNNA